MPKITPLTSIPATAPNGVDAASIANLSPSEFIWLSGVVTTGSVSLRIYFWEVEATSTSNIGGRWIALGGDALAGSSPVSFNATLLSGSANGRFINRRLGAYFVVVKEQPSLSLVIDFVHISAELSTVGT